MPHPLWTGEIPSKCQTVSVQFGEARWLARTAEGISEPERGKVHQQAGGLAFIVFGVPFDAFVCPATRKPFLNSMCTAGRLLEVLSLSGSHFTRQMGEIIPERFGHIREPVTKKKESLSWPAKVISKFEALHAPLPELYRRSLH
jgi:hypothetical protein